MSKRQATEYDEESEFDMKDEPTPSPPPVTPPKKTRKSTSSTTPTSASSSSPTKTPSTKGKGTPGSSAVTKKGVYMEMIFEAGLKAVNKKAVQDEVSDTWTTYVQGYAQMPMLMLYRPD